jgi:hypothetical protein
MNSRLFESFEGSGLGVRQSRFDTAFGKSPASAASLNQQEFDATVAGPVAHSGHLFAAMPFTRLQWPQQSGYA